MRSTASRNTHRAVPVLGAAAGGFVLGLAFCRGSAKPPPAPPTAHLATTRRACPPLARAVPSDIRTSRYFLSDSEDARTMPRDASVRLLRETAFRQASEAIRSPGNSALDFCNFARDPQFASLLHFVLFADLATQRKYHAGVVISILRDRRYLEVIEPLLVLGEASDSDAVYCKDFIQSMFPEAVIALELKGVSHEDSWRIRAKLDFWKEWWGENRYKYMRWGSSQEKIIAALKRPLRLYEDYLLASEPVQQVRVELGLDKVPWDGVERLIADGHGNEAAALLGYLWAEHSDDYAYVKKSMDSRVLVALLCASDPSNTAVLARLGLQWSVWTRGCLPEGLLTLVRDGANDSIRIAAGEVMVAQASQYRPEATAISEVLRLWASAHDDPIVSRFCVETMAAFLPPFAPESTGDAALAYWREFLKVRIHCFGLVHRSIEIGAPRGQGGSSSDDPDLGF